MVGVIVILSTVPRGLGTSSSNLESLSRECLDLEFAGIPARTMVGYVQKINRHKQENCRMIKKRKKTVLANHRF